MISQLAEACRDVPLFLDLHHLRACTDSARVLHSLINFSRLPNLHLIPTTDLTASDDYVAELFRAARKLDTGICLRLYRTDLGDPNLITKLVSATSRLGLTPNHIDLIVDLGIAAGLPSLEQICAKIPGLQEWRTFSVAAGSFPPDLGNLTLGSNKIERTEWLYWSNGIRAGRVERLPSFSDYSVQHPVLAEPKDRCNPSASIRYTVGAHWVVMRGQGLFGKNCSHYDQWPANAQLLRDSGDFCGDSFSAGDRFIAESAEHAERRSTPTKWLSAGINHHLTMTAQQIADFTQGSVAQQLDKG